MIETYTDDIRKQAKLYFNKNPNKLVKSLLAATEEMSNYIRAHKFKQ